MGFSHFLIDRPIFAVVISIIITILGALAFTQLPVAQYPEVAPPTIQVTASYPGATAKTVAETVATPLEQEINGVEGMLYMTSQSTADGRLSLQVTFEIGADLDTAQVLVQNRVAIAEPRLPEEVRRLGLTTTKNSPDLMMVIHMNSPDGSRSQLYVSNYALLQIRDQLLRIDGVGNIQIFGARDYSMRVWIDPDQAAARNLTAGDIVSAMRAQNVQVAGGVLNQPPTEGPIAFQTSVQTQGRLDDPAQFENIIVAADAEGRIVRLRDVARVELGAVDYSTNAYLDRRQAVALGVFQRPGSNALTTANEVLTAMDELSKAFPSGLAYNVAYNPTEFISQSIAEVQRTMIEATLLVVLVVVIFLQSWRAAIIPIVAIPVSLIGTFAVMLLLGGSINNLSLFGLVLAIGIVVDDAIVVVENAERNIENGKSPREAAHATIDDVGSALVATSLVLAAVFIPAALIGGISGQFYRQFAITIATSTAISTLVSLSLSPAMAAIFLKPRSDKPAANPAARALDSFFRRFNTGFERLSKGYSGLTGHSVRHGGITLTVYAALILLAGFLFWRTPGGFIPSQDQGYLIASIQLPPGAALDRTDKVVRRAIDDFLEIDGVKNAAAFAGFSGATFTNASNAGAIFLPLDDFEDRKRLGVTYQGILDQARQAVAGYEDAFVIVIPPPPVRGVGTGGGFKMMLQDRGALGWDALAQTAFQLAGQANQIPGLVSVFTLFETSTPQLYADIDLVKAEKLGVPPERVFETLEVYLGSSFVNDFNYLGRTYRVTAQADAPFRQTPDDVARLRTRNNDGDMVPIGSVARFSTTTGPQRAPRHNLYPAAEVQGDTLPGTSSGQALARMERLAANVLPLGMGYEWTELAFQQKRAGNTAGFVFALAVVFVFLVLAAQYESWSMPLAVILIVPMCLLSAIAGVLLRGMSNDILVQIGLIVLVGLASKNAILIVEFARNLEREGKNRFEAAQDAAAIRLRPILMTSVAFILGVVPLALAEGAGAEMRQALGTSVFFGMLGVTLFGLLFTPAFYVLTRRLAMRRSPPAD